MYTTLSGVHEAHRACAGADKLLSLGLEGEAAPERTVSLNISFSFPEKKSRIYIYIYEQM